MPEKKLSLEELMDQAVRGCEDSAAELVMRFEPQIRLEIRTRTSRSKVSRLIDSVDIAQSAMSDFLLGMRQREFQLTDPRHAIALLMKISQTKIKEKIRHFAAEKRDFRKTMSDSVALNCAQSQEPEPAIEIEQQDLLCWVESRMAPEEFAILKSRMNGKTWDEIGRELNLNSDAIRMRLRRTAKELGIDRDLLCLE